LLFLAASLCLGRLLLGHLGSTQGGEHLDVARRKLTGGPQLRHGLGVASCRQGFASRTTALADYDFGAVTLISQTGDDATVGVTATRAGHQTRESMHLVRTNGEWKIKLAP